MNVYAYEEAHLPEPVELRDAALAGWLKPMAERQDLMFGFCGAPEGTLYMEVENFAETGEGMLYLVAPNDERTGLCIEAHWHDGACWQAYVDAAGTCTAWDRIS